MDRPTIREAERSNLEALGGLCAEAFHLDPQASGAPGHLWRGPRSEPRFRLVAEVESRLAGAAFGSLHRDSRVTGDVDLLGVAPAGQRQGAATALLDELEQRLIEGGATELVVGLNTPYYAWPGATSATPPPSAASSGAATPGGPSTWA